MKGGTIDVVAQRVRYIPSCTCVHLTVEWTRMLLQAMLTLKMCWPDANQMITLLSVVPGGHRYGRLFRCRLALLPDQKATSELWTVCLSRTSYPRMS